jgi:hypothetical protein
VFDEARQWNWEDDNIEPVADCDLFTIKYTTELVQAPVLVAVMPTPSLILATPKVGGDGVQAAVNPEFDDDALDADHNDTPLRLQNVKDIIRDVPAPQPARRVLATKLNFTMADELASFKEAEQQESWHSAMHEEMQAI